MESKYLELYHRHVKDLKRTSSGNQWLGYCPFPACRSKDSPHFYINETNGLWDCKTCGASGNAIEFTNYFNEDSRPYYDIPPKSYLPDLSKVEQFHQVLFENRDVWPAPWQEDVVRLLQVGWDNQSKRFVFTIFDESGQVINLIWHKVKQLAGSKVTLYPLHLLQQYDPSYLVICEGMKDCVSLLSHRIQAVTSTGGAAAIPKDNSSLRRFKRFYLCLDNDEAGENGVERWLNRLCSEIPSVKILVCDLSDYVAEGGDVTDYLSLSDKTEETFITEVLSRARVGKPFSDVPDFIRQRMLSDRFISLKPRDQLVYAWLALRASRYRVQFHDVKGMKVRIRPGEYLTSAHLLSDKCGEHYSEKQIRNAWKQLREQGLIGLKVLSGKRGSIITLTGWDSGGRTIGQTDFEKVGRERFPFPPSIFTSNTIQNGQTESSEMGTKDGQHKEYVTLGEEDIYVVKNKRKNAQIGMFDE